MRVPRPAVAALTFALSGCAATPSNGAATSTPVEPVTPAAAAASPSPAEACELAAQMMATPSSRSNLALAAGVAAAAQHSGTESMKYLGDLLSRQIAISSAAVHDTGDASQVHAVTEAVATIDKFCRDPEAGVIVGGPAVVNHGQGKPSASGATP